MASGRKREGRNKPSATTPDESASAVASAASSVASSPQLREVPVPASDTEGSSSPNKLENLEEDTTVKKGKKSAPAIVAANSSTAAVATLLRSQPQPTDDSFQRELASAKIIAIDLLYCYLISREPFWAKLTQKTAALIKDVPALRRATCLDLITLIERSNNFEGIIEIINNLIEQANITRQNASSDSFLFDTLHALRNLFVTLLQNHASVPFNAHIAKLLSDYKEKDEALIEITDDKAKPKHENPGLIESQEEDLIWKLAYLENSMGMSRAYSHRLYETAKLAMPSKNDPTANSRRPYCLQSNLIVRVYDAYFKKVLKLSYDKYVKDLGSKMTSDKYAKLLKNTTEYEKLQKEFEQISATSILDSTFDSARGFLMGAANALVGWWNTPSAAPVAPNAERDTSEPDSAFTEEDPVAAAASTSRPGSPG